MQKGAKNSKILKNVVIFEFPTLKLVYNSIQTFAKMYFIFLTVCMGGGKVLEDFRKAIQLYKI